MGGGTREVVVHGHWGRPVLWFPSETRSAHEFGHHGMLGALAEPLDAGRIKVYCVDGYDHESWSASWKPMSDRAKAHRAYEDWIIWQVLPFITETSGGRDDVVTAGPSMGAFHAALFALRHAHLFRRVIAFSGGYNPRDWRGWGDQDTDAYLTNPLEFLPGVHDDHLDHLRRQLYLTLVVGSGQWEDTTGAHDSTYRLAGDPRREVDSARTPRVGRRVGARLVQLAGAGTRVPVPAGLMVVDPALNPAPQYARKQHRKTAPGNRAQQTRTDTTMSNRRGDDTTHLIGLLLGTENDWPRAFEALAGRLGPIPHRGRDHTLTTERITIEPFDLRDPVRHDLVIDRLAWWYFHPREWLKKAALVNDTYLLNNPFTFQAMEKHSAYCAIMRLGFDIPATVLVPYKNPVDSEKWMYTSSTYNLPFDLDEVANRVGFPMFMKPFDGGAWRGVSRIDDSAALHAAYDASGQMLMHLQAAVSPYDAFARSLTIGPETKVMKFRPELPMHDRYEVNHHFLAPEAGAEILTLSKVINAFFRWEFNSCEALVTGTRVQPIDYANACPDIAITSLHYYFPWAIQNLLSWSAFCTVTGRTPRVDTGTREWFEIADDPDSDFAEKLHRYGELADRYFQVEEYREFCATSLASLPDLVYDWVTSSEFDALLVETVRSGFPAHEQDRFIAHFRGLLGLWASDHAAGRNGS